jgi:hypothetical protein
MYDVCVCSLTCLCTHVYGLWEMRMYCARVLSYMFVYVRMYIGCRKLQRMTRVCSLCIFFVYVISHFDEEWVCLQRAHVPSD